MGERARRGAVIVVKIFIALVATASIAGCAGGQQPILTPIEVKVPVATPVYCRVAQLARPVLPIAELKMDSAPPDTIRAYAATVAILKGAVRERDLVIAGCAPPPDQQHAVPPADGATPVEAGEAAK
jgi:hypothetical protein